MSETHTLQSRQVRSVAIVGNAPVRRDQGAAIDACDIVVRCNHAQGFGAGRGSRVSELVLINCGGQMEEWLAEGSIEVTPAFLASERVALPIHPAKASLIEPALSAEEWRAALLHDFTAEARARFAASGKTVLLYGAGFFASSVAALGYEALTRDAPAPSTGYLAARWWLGKARSQALRCHAFGFGFEGWGGHDFAAERDWFDAMARSGRLSIHPPAEAVPPHAIGQCEWEGRAHV